MLKPIAITGLSSLSALGHSPKSVQEEYDNDNHQLTFDESLNAWVGKLPSPAVEAVTSIMRTDKNYQQLDPTVLFALLVSRRAVEQAGWQKGSDFGINIGSSRGATQLFEQYHADFLQDSKIATLASPTTTLGNISSWVAQDLQNDGPDISHSITCSTALHALLNGVAWIRSGMCEKFLVGGSEAALTPFTIAQMRAMKVLASSPKESEYPCRAFDLEKRRNTMVLGEGASSICLENGERENALAYITGIGYATEKLNHAVSISAEADCFQKSMKMALGNTSPESVDVIVMHAPGTILGDRTEYKAIQNVFTDKTPLLTTNKWKLGHTFGASGLLSLELAIHMLRTQKFAQVPFIPNQDDNRVLRHIMVNAVGFGGNAVSILLSKA